MRNETFTLDSETARKAIDNHKRLLQAQIDGLSVSFRYTKRTDSSVSTRSGRVMGFHGATNLSTGSVRLMTDVGERVFNLWLIDSVSTGEVVS